LQTLHFKKYLRKLLGSERVSHCNEMSIFYQLFTTNILSSPIALLAILQSSPVLHQTTIEMGMMDILNLDVLIELNGKLVQTHHFKKYLSNLLGSKRVRHYNEMGIFRQLSITNNIVSSPMALAILQ